MLNKIDHIGIIVKDIVESSRFFCENWGFQSETAEETTDSSGSFRSVFLTNGGVKLELISPTSTNSPLFRYLEKRGEGIHHISMEVSDIEQQMRSLSAKGQRLISNGAELVNGQKVAFVHPAAAKGVLIEMTQKSVSSQS